LPKISILAEAAVIQQSTKDKLPNCLSGVSSSHKLLTSDGSGEVWKLDSTLTDLDNIDPKSDQ